MQTIQDTVDRFADDVMQFPLIARLDVQRLPAGRIPGGTAAA